MRKILFTFILALLFTGCRLFDEDNDTQTIVIALPVWPPDSGGAPAAYPPLSRWKITLATSTGVQSFFTTDTSVEVITQKNCPLSLQATPVTLLENGCECLYFHPAGCVYPAGGTSATWSHGYPALIMQKLYENCQLNGATPPQAARYVSTFNWAKACSLIETKLAECTAPTECESPNSPTSPITKFYNPWLCDTARIIKNLTDETFRTSLLTPTSCYSISTTELYTQTNLAILSPFIPENLNISKNHQITVKKDTPTLLSDIKEFGIFLNYKSAKNVLIEYIYIPIYKGEL